MRSASSSIFDITDRNIWVVGGAGYLGTAIVKLLSELGAHVFCVDLDGQAERLVQENDLPRVTPGTIGVSDSGEIEEFVYKQIANSGVPDGLVNLSFASTAKSLEELSAKEFDEVNQRGLTHTFILTRALGIEMAKKRRGSIVLFSSMYGMVSPYPDLYDLPLNKNPIEYGVGKAGITHMTRYLAVHWGRSNVRCNCISPGPFPNPMVQKEHPEFVRRLSEKSPMGRIGNASEIAGCVAFLLSDAAAYVTGQNLQVDGGWTCW